MTELPHDLTASQHGLVTAEQLSAAKLDAGPLVDTRRLAPVTRQVFRLLGSPSTEAQRVLAVVLDAGPGSALSHSSALAWWHVPWFGLKQIHVTGSQTPSLLDTKADRERKARLEAAGFVTVVVTDAEVWHYPEVVVEKVRVGRYEANLRKLRNQAPQHPHPTPDPVGASP